MSIKIKDLSVGQVVWESCQQGNARLTVIGEPERQPGCGSEFWQCRVRWDNGQEFTIGGDTPLYVSPLYMGVRWECDPENIPAWMRDSEEAWKRAHARRMADILAQGEQS